MRNYIIRRVLLMIPTFLVVTLTIFFLLRLVPGNVIDLMVAQSGVAGGGEMTRLELERALGLGEAVHVQYVRWIWGIIQGDFGKHIWDRTPIIDDILHRLPISFELGFLALITALIIALPLGIFSAIRQDTAGDYIGRTIAIIFISVPTFWIGTMVMVYPSVWWGWAPEMEYIPFFKDPIKNLAQFIIPALIMGMVMSGTTMRMTRTMMLEVLRQDYVRTAWSKGLTEKTVVTRHALKNALIPVVTIVGMQVPVLIAGSVILETIFNLPGIGLLLIQALGQRDYPAISGINVFMATFVLIMNLVVDLAYGYLDPRVQYH
jgi:peptide/nickel transport system permease protein